MALEMFLYMQSSYLILSRGRLKPPLLFVRRKDREKTEGQSDHA